MILLCTTMCKKRFFIYSQLSRNANMSVVRQTISRGSHISDYPWSRHPQSTVIITFAPRSNPLKHTSFTLKRSPTGGWVTETQLLPEIFWTRAEWGSGGRREGTRCGEAGGAETSETSSGSCVAPSVMHTALTAHIITRITQHSFVYLLHFSVLWDFYLKLSPLKVSMGEGQHRIEVDLYVPCSFWLIMWCCSWSFISALSWWTNLVNFDKLFLSNIINMYLFDRTTCVEIVTL